jgi:hypothetical protein
MKKLITNLEGGFPLRLDDLGFIQEAPREALYGLFSAFGITKADSFKLSGCQVDVSGNTYTCSAGYIVYEGEVLPVYAHSISSMGTVGFYVKTSWDPQGLKEFKPPAGQKNTYQLRYAELGNIIPTVSQSHMSYNAPTLHQIIKNKILALEESWSPLSLLNDCNNVGGNYQDCQYKKDNSGKIHLRGTLNREPYGLRNGLQLLLLPPLYRPSKDICFIVPAYRQASSDYETYATLKIDISGYAILQSYRNEHDELEYPGQISLDGISFFR